jgi:glycosyltransferase involved in cell wall biosynthesis
LRLLILAPEFGVSGGGIATFYRHLAPALRDLGVEVRVIEGSAMHAGPRAPRELDGVTVETLEYDRFRRWWDRFPAFAAVPGLRRHLAAAWAMWEQGDFGAGADIVEATDWGLLFLPPVMEARSPIVVQGHGSIGQIAVHDHLLGEETQNALERLIESQALSSWAPFQTYSRANAEFWRVESGADVQMIRPAIAVRQSVSTLAPSARGLVVGRIQRWKGPDTVCTALRVLGNRAPDIDWFGRDMAFGRQGTSTGQNLAKSFPDVWGKSVVSHPSIPPEEVQRAQAGALFNLVPSTWDVFNFTAAEAMASGRPTIISTGAGASELVIDGENGFLFTAGDAQALAGVIERVLASPPLRLIEIGAAGRETARRELDPSAIAAARVSAYRSAIDAFNESPPTPIDGWLGEICRPDAAGPVNGAFLDQIPVRTLAAHLVRRIQTRLRSAVSKGSGRT